MQCRLPTTPVSRVTSHRATRLWQLRRERLHTYRQVPVLDDWDLETFRAQAFAAGLPRKLKSDPSNRLPAADLWFEASVSAKSPPSPRLRYDALAPYGTTSVWLELTQTTRDSASLAKSVEFKRFEAPLQLFLDWMRQNEAQAQALQSDLDGSSPSSSSHLYLAQQSLTSLPAPLTENVPTPSLVMNAGKGDVYASSLWMGLTPTYTPLHRDPNPNLFVQLCGTKTVRLFEPDLGRAIWQRVRSQIKMQDEKAGGAHAAFRGEEMMQGAERELLEKNIWASQDVSDENKNENENENETKSPPQRGFEAKVSAGEALFIPTGWWHSIKSLGEGVTASVNWWFR